MLLTIRGCWSNDCINPRVVLLFLYLATILITFVLLQRSGRLEEEIELLELKLKNVEEGIAFGGKRTKIARSQGKKVQITIEKEYARLYLLLFLSSTSALFLLV